MTLAKESPFLEGCQLQELAHLKRNRQVMWLGAANPCLEGESVRNHPASNRGPESLVIGWRSG